MQKIRAMLAFIQFCIFFFIVGSRFTSQLPLDFFKVSVIITPRFVFVLGNAIVVILVLLKSAGDSLDKDNNNNNNGSVSIDNVGFSDQQMMKEHGRNNQYVYNNEPRIRRSKSENMARLHRLKEAAALRRPATFTCRKRDVVAPVAATDEMSNEDFRRRVEAFIARQQRSLREEEFSSLLVSCES